jgi:hypothetical protein
MPITQIQIDALKTTAATLTSQVNALVADTLPVLDPTIKNFAASQSTITLGQVVVLNAIVTNADTLKLNGVDVTLPVTVKPPDVGPEVYALTATGMAGSTPVTETLTVQVNEVVVPPPSGELVPVKGPRQISMQLSWMADFILASALTQREVPWTIQPDPTTGMLVKPMKGRRPARRRVWHHLTAIQGLYSHYPSFGPDGLSAPYEPNVGSDIAAIANDLRKRPMPVGRGRGIDYLSPYCSVVSHPPTRDDGTVNPRMPLWLCLRHDGRMLFWHRIIGVQDAGQIPGINYCTVFAVDRIGRTTFLVCDFGVPDMGTPSKWTKSRIARVERATGKQTATVPEDASKYVVTTFYDMPKGLPVSVRFDDQNPPNAYVADNLSGNITKHAFDGTFLGVVANVPGIVSMSWEAGKLHCVVNTSEIKVVDLATGMVGPNINLIPGQVTGPSAPYGGKFWGIEVDRFGTCGIKGTLYVTRDIGGGNLDAWMFEPDLTSTVGYKDATWRGGHSRNIVGDYETVGEPFGHYPWNVTPHDEEGLLSAAGVSGQFQMIACYEKVTDAPPDIPDSINYKYEFANRGMKVWMKGGVKASPFNKPSLCCITTKEGASPFKDCSFDEMAEKPFDDTEAFIQGGLIGQFRRDDIAGEDLYCVLRMVYLNSLRGLREGQQVVLDTLNAWWQGKGRKVPDNIDPAGHPVTVFGDERGIYAQSNADGTGVEMWYRDYKDPYPNDPNKAIPIPAGATIIVDEGTPFESMTLTHGDHALTVRGAGMTRAIVVRK